MGIAPPAEMPVSPAHGSPAASQRLPRPTHAPLPVLLLLSLIVALALAVRLYDIGRLGLHYDEAWTQERATGRGSAQGEFEPGRIYHGFESLTSLRNAPPWWRIWTSLGGVTQPPLFPLVLRGWRAAGAGDGDIACRALSAVLSTAAVLVFFEAVRARHGTTPALWAAAFLAFSSAQVELAQEIRPYALLVLLGVGAIAALFRIEMLGPSIGRAIALAGCVFGMMLTHYYAIGAVAAIYLYVVIAMRGAARRQALLATTVGMVVFALSWGPMLMHQRAAFGDADNALRDQHGAGHVLETGARVAQLPTRLLFEPREEVAVAAYGGAVLLLSPLLLLRGRRRDLLLWILWAGGVIGVVAVLDVLLSTWQLLLIRYTLLASPAVCALIAVILPPSRPVARNALCAVVLLGLIMALPGAYTRAQQDFRGLATYLANNVRPGEIVVFYRSPQAAWYGQTLFLGVSHYAGPRDWPFVICDAPPDARLSRELSAAPGVWLVSGIEGIEPAQLFPGGDARREGPMLFPYLATCERIRGPREAPKPPPHVTTSTTKP